MTRRSLRRGPPRPLVIAILTAGIVAAGYTTALGDPTISGAPNGTLGPGGWYRATTQINWNVGFDLGWSAWPPQPSSAAASEGTNQYDSGAACETNDGGTTVVCNPGVTQTFKVDNSKPVVGAGAADRPPNAAGWYRAPVTVGFPCSDAVSGILGGACPAVTLSGSGAGQTISGQTVSDLAGNTATSPSYGPVNIDQVAPAIGITSPSSKTYPYNNNGVPVASAFTCTDALSGIAGACPGSSNLLLAPLTSPATVDPSSTPDAVGVSTPVPMTPGGRDRSFVASATDNAGNIGVGQVIYHVAPALPGLSQPGSATALRKPLFTWSNSPDSFVTKYDVFVDGLKITPAAGVAPGAGGAPAGYTSFRYAGLDLAIGTHHWYVKATGQNGTTSQSLPAPPGRSFTVDPRTPAAPQITGGPVGATNNATPAFSWASPVPNPTFHWKVVPNGVPDDAVPWQTTNATQAVAGPLGEGGYTFLVDQTDPSNGLTGDDASLSFSVDLTPPPPPTFTGGPGAATGSGSPSFSWAGEPGGTYYWSVVGAGGVARSGALDGTSVAIAPALDPGAWAFFVQQRDAAGNLGATSAYGFTVVPPPPAAPVQSTGATVAGAKKKRATSVLTPRTLNARFLLPKAGARITNLRPVLRWKIRPKGVQIYNVQVFKGSRKVLSRFPTRQSLRLPAGILKPGARYIWRVWPYFGAKRGYSAKPLGLSYLDTVAVTAKKATKKQ